MQINILEVSQDQFQITSSNLNGEIIYLIQPNHIGAKFNQKNKIFRSSVWNSKFELISASFPKFTNWGENPENFPVPTSLNNCVVMDKLDGSCLIVSKYKNNYIIRTRGTVDAFKMENGYELESFNNDIVPLIDLYFNNIPTWDVSVLFEWLSPTNKIVINYDDNKPLFKLTGIINHIDYSLWEQDNVDNFAKQLQLERPTVYSFTSVEDLIHIVSEWKGKEGVVLYSNKGQCLHKIKSVWYLSLHRMKEALSSIDKVVDTYFELNCPVFSEFEQFICSQFDYELWCQIRGESSRICDAYKEAVKIRDYMIEFITPLKVISRKDAAQKIISSYGQSNRASFCFSLLDGKELDKEQMKKLTFQCLKK